MASPFENLLQAAQFAVQTRANYDQMAERRRENTMSLMQRRSEQEQQNQQFLSEMNLKDRQQRMQEDQFNKTTAMQYAIERNRDIRAQEQIDLARETQKFRQEVELPAQIRLQEQGLGLQARGVSLQERKLNFEIQTALKAEEAAKEPSVVGLPLASSLANYPFQEMEEAPKEGTIFKEAAPLQRAGYNIKRFLALEGLPDKEATTELMRKTKSEAVIVSRLVNSSLTEIEQKVSQAIQSNKPLNPADVNSAIYGINRAINALEGRGIPRKEYEALVERRNRVISQLSPSPQSQQ